MCKILRAKEEVLPPIDRGNDNNAIHKNAWKVSRWPFKKYESGREGGRKRMKVRENIE